MANKTKKSNSKNQVAISNKNKTTNKKTKFSDIFKNNYILWILISILIIPVIILGSILLQSVESTGEPIIGNRFEGQLDPAITNEQIEQIKTNVTFEGATIQVNLRTATLRVLVDLSDDATSEQVRAAAVAVYAQVVKILPEDKYFTNKDGIKMYDIEVSAYNVLEDTNAYNVIHIIKSKTGAQETASITDMSTPRDPDTSDELLEGRE